ncbi:MAG TPA: (2Fe-2S)-binding protein [Pseudomonadota bacterium]|nr:(2Fe-2S)-binding protein [Pseudomonadota bacterium]HNN51090.1 (2Fe-2S)-binding protein [Pseudomonadota bacterium]HNO67640.1 (2Fe-2S)-binding protein [Pseudomonadota bacterium]
MKLTMTVNGVERTCDVHPLARLLDVLRRDFQLPGTKEGCGEGECGACSVFVDGQLVNSCLVPAMQAAGRDVQTIEGVAPSAELIDRVQQAFVQHGGAQCGICTPGMILAAKALLKEHPQPTVAQIREGLAGNLCRCTGYTKIFESVLAATQQAEEQP